MRLQCNGLTLGLDCPEGDVSFLSHAHRDHSAGMRRQKKIIASEETLALANLESRAVRQGEHATLGCRLIPAGHMLGSRQMFFECDGKATVYTGDISTRENIFGERAEIPQCERLIMEATYGSDPAYRFPPHEEVYSQIASFIRSNDSSNVILGCYEMGKSQEMVKILNERCGIAPIVNQGTEEICSVYSRFGVHLERLVIGSPEAEEAMGRRFVAIVPMRHAKRWFAKRLSDAFGRKTLCAAATGWALTERFDTDAAFPLSDHADFYELRDYIEQSGAKEVEFFCGDGRALMESLSLR